MNLVDKVCTHWLNFVINDPTHISPANKAVKSLEKTSFVFQTSLLSNLAGYGTWRISRLGYQVPQHTLCTLLIESFSSLVFCHILSLHTFVWNPCVWFCEHFTTIIITVKKPRYITHMYVAKLVKPLYACHNKLIKCHIETCCDLCTYP